MLCGVVMSCMAFQKLMNEKKRSGQVIEFGCIFFTSERGRAKFIIRHNFMYEFYVHTKFGMVTFLASSLLTHLFACS